MQTQYLILKVYMGQELEFQQAIRKTVKTSSIGVTSLPKTVLQFPINWNIIYFWQFYLSMDFDNMVHIVWVLHYTSG